MQSFESSIIASGADVPVEIEALREDLLHDEIVFLHIILYNYMQKIR